MFIIGNAVLFMTDLKKGILFVITAEFYHLRGIEKLKERGGDKSGIN